MPTLTSQVVALEAALGAAHVPHAFGGALALAYHIAEPRGTRDIDLNLFIDVAQARRVLEQLPPGVEWQERHLRSIERDGQVRLFWDETPIDLFFANHPFHEHARANTERVPFDAITIPILGAIDLVVFKAFFDRTKDWADIEAMLDAGSFDLHSALGWLTDLLGGDDHRVERLRSLAHRSPPGSEPRFAP